MRTALRNSFCAAVLVFSCTAAAAQSVNFAAYGAVLKEGMTESEVVSAIGYRPSAVSLETCGAKTAHPWRCKIYEYGSLFTGELRIYLSERGDDTWVVDSWSASAP
jgi:hypothetical protein